MTAGPDAGDGEYFSESEARALVGRRYRATSAYARVPAGAVGAVSGVYSLCEGRFGVDVTWEGIACGSPLGVERCGLTDGFSRRDLGVRFTAGPHEGVLAMVPLDDCDGPIRLTPARRRALEVLVRAAQSAARESNDTSDPATVDGGTQDPRIYWQSRNWLSANALIEAVPDRPNWYRLSGAGAAAAVRLGLTVGEAGARGGGNGRATVGEPGGATGGESR